MQPKNSVPGLGGNSEAGLTTCKPDLKGVTR
jgi:hypothetical protein